MAGYTKEEYDNLYRFRVCRYFRGIVPPQTSPVYLNYHKYPMKPLLEARWATLAPILNIASSELCLIVGAGFGWSVDAFIAETGCTTVGIDISSYVHSVKDGTEEAEIRAAITAAGLDPDTGYGNEILLGVCDFQPRTNVIVLNEDASTNTSRNNIRSALGGWPTVCIVEELIDDTTTDQEITQVNNALNLFAGNQRVIWIYRGMPSRSLQDLQTLTGSEVITPDGQTHLGAPA